MLEVRLLPTGGTELNETGMAPLFARRGSHEEVATRLVWVIRESAVDEVVAIDAARYGCS
jgi:hypothetical protein